MNPSPSSFYTTGGTLSQDAPSYIERQADHQLLRGLRAGEFCYVLTSRQMGKSSLMVRTATRLHESGAQVIVLDLTAVGQNVTPEQWYDGLLAQMGRQLRLEEQLDAFWLAKERLGACQRFFAAIRDVLLLRQPKPLVIFVDEIDTVRSLPFSTDEFFAAIRECYNRRVHESDFQRLTFCLLGVATPSDLIRDTRTTPFNIGRRIELHDFTEEEAAPLAQGMQQVISRETPTRADAAAGPASSGARTAKRLLSRILHWTGGHPYLTQRFCRAVAEAAGARSPSGVDRICDALFFSNRAKERDDNLLFVRERLLRSETHLPSLLELYLKVRRGDFVEDDETSPQVSVLRLSGVVKSAEGRLIPRNRIYSRVFGQNWVNAHMPDADRRRLRAAFYHGVIRTSAIAALVIAALAVATVIAVRQASNARLSLAQAYFSQARASRASGLAGQREESLRALDGARRYHTNLTALRDEALACLALVDSKEAPDVAAWLPSSNSILELAPNLEVAAVAAPDGTTHLRQLKDGRVLTKLPSPGRAVARLRFSPRQDLLAVAYRSPSQDQIAVWDWRKGLKLFEASHGMNADAMDFSADGKRLAIGCPDGRIKVYAMPGGGVLAEWEPKLDAGTTRLTHRLRFHPSADWLALSSQEDQYVQVWSVTATQRVDNLYHSDLVNDISWHPRGQLLAAGCDDSSVYLWKTNDFGKSRDVENTTKFKGHEGRVTSVSFNHRGTLLASLGADDTVRLWIPATGRQMTRNLVVDASGRIRFSSDDQHLIEADGQSLKPRVWEVLRELLMVLPVQTGAGDEVRAIDFSPDNLRLLAASAKQITFWDTRTGRETGFVPHANSQSTWFTADSQHLIASGDSGLLKWPLVQNSGTGLPCLRTGTEQRMYEAFDSLGMMALSLDRMRAAIIHQGEVVVVNLEPPAVADLKTHKLKNHYPLMALHPQASWVATRKADSDSVHVWNLSNASAQLASADIPGSKYFAFSPDGNWFAICSAGQFNFYRVGAWQKRAFFIPRLRISDQHAPVAFSRDGRMVALAASRYVIQLFRLPEPDGTGSYELIATLESPDRLPLASLAFRPDGRQLAAATDGALVQLWNLAGLREELAALDLQGRWPAYPE